MREELRQAVEWLPLLLLLLPPRTSEVAETCETNGISQREPMKLILVQAFTFCYFFESDEDFLLFKNAKVEM